MQHSVLFCTWMYQVRPPELSSINQLCDEELVLNTQMCEFYEVVRSLTKHRQSPGVPTASGDEFRQDSHIG